MGLHSGTTGRIVLLLFGTGWESAAFTLGLAMVVSAVRVVPFESFLAVVHRIVDSSRYRGVRRCSCRAPRRPYNFAVVAVVPFFIFRDCASGNSPATLTGHSTGHHTLDAPGIRQCLLFDAGDDCRTSSCLTGRVDTHGASAPS